MTGPPLTISEHVERSRYHKRVGDALHSSGPDSWGAVCYFYSAFHLVRAALTRDPIFSDLSQLKKAHPGLIPDDRGATAHQARRGSERRFGVNDLVRILHPDIFPAYYRLHGASVGVRYEKGISSDLDGFLEDLEDIEEHFATSDACERLEDLRELLQARAEK